ncbi:MAG: hypothetical protein AAB354_04820 [candidate division KSB1 bacterium]
MPSQTIHLYALAFERSMRASAVQHGIAGFLLVLAGFEHLQEPNGARSFFTWLAILAGATVLVAVAFELRSLRRHEHGNFGWVDLFSVPVLLIEGFHKLHLGKKYLPYPYFLVAVLMLARGFLFHRLLHLRHIRLHETGLSARTSPFRKLQLQWRDVRNLSCADSKIAIEMTSGRTHMIDLKNIRNKDEAQNAVLNFYRHIQTTSDE